MPQGLQKAIMWKIYFQKTRYNCRPLKTPPQGFIITFQVFPPQLIHKLSQELTNPQIPSHVLTGCLPC